MNGSSDIGDIISKLTENPEMMKNLMGVANSLMSKDGEKSDARGLKREDRFENKYEEKFEGKYENEYDEKRGGNGEMSTFNPSIDKKMRNKGDDAENLIRLLIALRPFVGEEKCSKIDGIIKILKLVQLSEKTGILRSLI